MDKENSKGASRTRRGKDFSPQETSTLMEFVSANKKELFGTGGKGSSKEEKVKIRTWKRAGHALRAAGGPERDWSTIRKKWRDLASKAKAYNAPKTGGGPAPEKNPALERVLEILAKEVVEGILPEDDLMESQESAITDEQLEENQTWPRQHQLHASSSISSSSSSAAAASVPPTSTSSSSAAAFSSSSSAAAVPASKQKHPKPAQHHPKLSPKPAQIRQLEIQERLLSIQEAKLKVKQQSVQIQQAMLEELKSINYSLRATLAPINQSNNQQYQGYDFNPLV